LRFFFKAAFVDFFGAFTLPLTIMIMICSSAKLSLCYGDAASINSSARKQVDGSKRRVGKGV
jgi:hypothetical protein